MVIVESKQEVQNFLELWNTEISTIIPIWCDLDKHPQNNSLSFLFVSFKDDSYVIPFEHTDCLTPEIDLSESETMKWVWDKKSILQCKDLNIKGLRDIQTYLFFSKNEIYPLEDKLEVLRGFYTRLGIRDELGKSIPIMKFIEVLSQINKDFQNLPQNENVGKIWIDDDMIPTLSEVERLGIKVDKEKFFDKWDAKYHAKHLKGDIIYTQFNPYTITSRPANSHGGINFSALNKDDGTRDIFIPREGKVFVQLDYDAYHIRIMAKIINYDIPDDSGHQWLAKQYGCDYGEAKVRTFQNIYGGIRDKHIPFFKEVDKFIQTFWSNTKHGEFIQTPKRRIPLKYVQDANAQKVFNYLLQSMETELNMDVLKKLNEMGHTPLFYTYDSFLFEVDKGDKDTVRKIKEIVEYKGFPSKIGVGMNYSEV